MSTNVLTGSALFSDTESFMGFVQDLSEQDELMLVGGGGSGHGGGRGKGGGGGHGKGGGGGHGKGGGGGHSGGSYSGGSYGYSHH